MTASLLIEDWRPYLPRLPRETVTQLVITKPVHFNFIMGYASWFL